MIGKREVDLIANFSNKISWELPGTKINKADNRFTNIIINKKLVWVLFAFHEKQGLISLH